MLFTKSTFFFDTDYEKEDSWTFFGGNYQSFGSTMTGRTFSSEKYRFGFNGKENDNEVKGQGAQQDYGFRIYDPRLGRFLSVDPITKYYPELTPYQFAGNRPIRATDLDGLEPRDFNMSSYVSNWFGDAFIGLASWFDNKFSKTTTSGGSQTVYKTKLGPVTNETNVKASVSKTTSTNIASKLKYIKRNNTSQGDPAPVVVEKNNTKVEIENKTSVELNQGATKVTVSNSTTITSDGSKATNTTSVGVDGVVDGIPLTSKSSVSVSTDGSTQKSASIGVGTSGNNIGVGVSSSENSNGSTTTSGGVNAKGSVNSSTVTSGASIDVNTKDPK
jgi:RHS repeat-associated protein